MLFVVGQALGLLLSVELSITDSGFMLAVITTVAALVVGLFALLCGGLKRYFAYPSYPIIIQALAGWTLFAVVVQALGGYLDESPMDFMDGLLNSTNVLWVWLAVAVVAPIGEELVFRGLIFERLAAINQAVAWLGSSVLFALVHWQYNWFGLLAIFVLALFLCYVRVKSGGLVLPVAIHSLNNAVAMALYTLGD